MTSNGFWGAERVTRAGQCSPLAGNRRHGSIALTCPFDQLRLHHAGQSCLTSAHLWIPPNLCRWCSLPYGVLVLSEENSKITQIVILFQSFCGNQQKKGESQQLKNAEMDFRRIDSDRMNIIKHEKHRVTRTKTPQSVRPVCLNLNTASQSTSQLLQLMLTGRFTETTLSEMPC